MSNETPAPQSHDPYKAPGGDFPAPPPLDNSVTERPPRPKSVDQSFLWWIIAAVVSIAGSLIALTNSDRFVEEIARNSRISMESAEKFFVATNVVLTVVLTAIWLVFVFYMRNQRNWARIILTIIGGIVLLSAILNIGSLQDYFSAGGLGVVQGILSIARLVAIIVAIIYQFTSESNKYFATTRS